jgi:UDP-N-acetylglucosamine 2-epimerase (non-hydrolysing)
MLEIWVVLGTRPEAIKMAPVIRALRQHPGAFRCRVVVTAQHRDMLDQVMRAFALVPDCDLDIMTEDQDLIDITSRVLTGLRRCFALERPDLVLVHGDTTTTLAAALASFYHRIPVGHVEAGLRTRQHDSPFPEEMNRHLTGVLARVHFAPTAGACRNLLAEGVPRADIVIAGNTAIDAVLLRLAELGPAPIGAPTFASNRRGILVTAHRRENFGEGIKNICEALREIALLHPDVHVIYPVHQNPNVRGPAHRILGDVPGVSLLPPLDYDAFIRLMAEAELILTDSGGIQEEAPSLGKPVLVLREVTERPEAIEAGTGKLVGARRESIVQTTLRLLEDREEYLRMARAVNPYGDGHAAERIVAALASRFGVEVPPLAVPREFLAGTRT